MSVHMKIFDTMGRRERRIGSRRLELLKNAVNNQEDSNPLNLINILLDDNLEATDNKEKLSYFNVIRQIGVKVVKFIVRVAFVMAMFYTSALMFAHFEDEDVHHGELKTNETNIDVSNATSLWKFLQTEYDTELTEKDYQYLNEMISNYVQEMKIRRMEQATEHDGDVSHLKIQKWFYFVVIASTTIGYGDVTPKSQNGKIFYCCFSVIGIILMMSLLKQCGMIISAVNNHVFYAVRRYICPPMKKWCREESINLMITTTMFFSYLCFGIAHDKEDSSDDHSLVDIIYFWVATFTTTGFGDIGHPLEFEIEHAYELTVYRVFGLSLVAAMIDSILTYISFRSETIRSETEACQRKILERVQKAVTKAKDFHEKKFSTANGFKWGI